MKKNIYLMYAISFLQGMVFYGPVATLYRQAQGVSIFQITLMEGVSLALCIALEIPWGMAADKIGYRRTMILCCGLYFVSKLVFWRATGLGGFFVERILLGIVQSGLSGVDSSILYLSCRGRDSQRVFGAYHSLGMGGLLAAAAVFSLLVKDNYPLAGFLTAVSYGASAVLSFFLEEAREGTAGRARAEAFGATCRAVLKDRSLLVFLAAVAFLSETHQTITVFLNQLQYSRCGMGSAAIGFAYCAATVLGLCGVWSFAVTRRIGVRPSFWLFGGMAAAACITLALTRQAALSVAGILLLRLSNSLFQPLQAEVQNRRVKTENRATALSVHAMILDGIAIGTNLVFGALSQFRLPLAFAFGGGLCVLSLALFPSGCGETGGSRTG